VLPHLVLAVALLLPACSGRSSAAPSEGAAGTGQERGGVATTRSRALAPGGRDAARSTSRTALRELPAGTAIDNGTGTGPSGSTTTTGRSSGATTTTTRSGTGTTTTSVPSLGAKGGQTCTTSSGSQEQCCTDPDPRQCEAYDLTGGRAWTPEADGTIRIEYWTNPQACPFTAATLVETARVAAETWNAAHPKLRFVHRGPTDQPATTTAYNNVVGCGECGLGSACVSADTHSEKARFHFVLNLRTKWDMTMCGPTNGTPCTDSQSTGSGIHLQSTMTHEDGHLVCYTRDLYNESTSELTMFGTGISGVHHRATLGRGDLLMARACYGWAPMPTIQVP
jgi:hypothetical protein